MRTAIRILIIALAASGLSIIALPLVRAGFGPECCNPSCSHTIKIIPVGTVPDEDPIVTTTPADLMIFSTGQEPVENVWLLVVLNEETYNALDNITIDDATFMIKADFALASTSKIPPALPENGYPGSNCRYEVTAIKSKMDEKGNNVYYAIKSFLNEITKDPTCFTLEVEVTTSVPDLKALVLALGRYDRHHFDSLAGTGTNCFQHCPEPFNTCSSFSKSTLVVPEPATLAIATAPFGALGLAYAARRKKQ